VPSPTLIRRALPSEAEALSTLAVRSKAHWGYDEAFLRAVHDDLSITAAQVETWIVYTLVEASALRGFYALRPVDDHTLDLERLFVDPLVLGEGYGRQLFEHAVETARQRTYHRIDIASDPYAEEFYLCLGAVRVGNVSSPIAGRTLPLLRFEIRSN
jgi:GNAT superfamily N-acetyltransferase